MEKEYIEREAAYDMDTLEDWYINSVMPNDTPVWTEKHLEELLNDFYVIPKDTPAADVAPVVRCKDCRFYEQCCRNIRSGGNKPDDFCSYGERKEKENAEIH